MELVLIVIVVIFIIGLLPHWPYSTGWGYGYWPSSLLGLILLILLVLLLTGHRI